MNHNHNQGQMALLILVGVPCHKLKLESINKLSFEKIKIHINYVEFRLKRGSLIISIEITIKKVNKISLFQSVQQCMKGGNF